MNAMHMNQLNTLTLFALGLALAVAGCKPEIEGELGDPIDKRAGFLGTWELSSFTQQDLNNPVKEVRDLSHLYIQEGIAPLRMNFNDDDSYGITQEIGREYFGDGGMWAFDDPAFPTFLILMGETDTLQYNLGTTVRPYDDQMAIEYRRSCGEGGALVETVIYTFTFNRIPQ
jgi:hypothetical protein